MNKSRIRYALTGVVVVIAIAIAVAAWIHWSKTLYEQFYAWDSKKNGLSAMVARNMEGVREGEQGGRELYVIEMDADLTHASPSSGKEVCNRFIAFMTAKDGRSEDRGRFRVEVFKDGLQLAEDIPGQNLCREIASVPKK